MAATTPQGVDWTLPSVNSALAQFAVPCLGLREAVLLRGVSKGLLRTAEEGVRNMGALDLRWVRGVGSLDAAAAFIACMAGEGTEAAGWPRLRTLLLYGALATQEVLDRLAGAAGDTVTTVYIDSRSQGDGVVAALRGFPHLTKLALRNSAKITPGALAETLRSLPALNAVDFAGCGRVNDEVLATLAACCPKLTDVSLKQCFRVSADAIAALGSLPLTRLVLDRDVHVTSASLAAFATRALAAQTPADSSTALLDNMSASVWSAITRHKASLPALPEGAAEGEEPPPPPAALPPPPPQAESEVLVFDFSGGGGAAAAPEPLPAPVKEHWAAVGEKKGGRFEAPWGGAALPPPSQRPPRPPALAALDSDLASLPCAPLVHLDVSNCLKVSRLQSLLLVCRRLAWVDLSGCAGLRSASLEVLGAVAGPTLRHLDISGCKTITGGDVVALGARVPGLQSLVLNKCRQAVKDGTLTALAGSCPTLRRLGVNSCVHITDAGLAAVGTLVELQYLDVEFCHRVTDAGLMAVMAGCPRLQDLNIRLLANLTTASVTQLGLHCPGLRRLRLGGVDSPDAVAGMMREVHADVPGLQASW